MKNLWNDKEAEQFKGELAQRVYTSRLLGRDSSLVLHGGGNTSVKITETSITGRSEEILYVKGSGWDLVTIEEAGFAPVKMAPLLELAKLETLTDPQMVNELKTSLTLATAPSPSVETILHATLPYKYVDHTHADAIVAITNTDQGEAHIKKIYGDQVVVIPYVMPGFDLARLCAKLFATEAGSNTIGMVLLNHGIFSFADNAKASYDRMITLVNQAEAYLAAQDAWTISMPSTTPSSPDLVALATLRHDLSLAAGKAMIVTRDTSQIANDFVHHPDVTQLSQQGPATPDHVIRTKRLPMLGTQLGSYTDHYARYFSEHAPQAKDKKSMLDPAPRIVIDPDLGLLCAGQSIKDAFIVRDIYQHTIEVILRANALGGYQALSAQNLFDMEYWDLEQAKLKKGGTRPPFTGEVALVTGAASGIGHACVTSLLARGAAVVGIDLDNKVTQIHDRPDYLGIVCDVTQPKLLQQVLTATANHFGGLDMLVLNAGLFPGGCRIETLADEDWRKVMAVNLDANFSLMRASYPLLKLAPNGGRVVVIGSKNVPAPGPGAAAYSASKAALNQLARVAALEWGADHIRINSLHPNAVFDTALWTDDVLQARAQHYGLTVDQYKRNNVLQTEITSRDVAELAAELCGVLFAKTTAAQIPIDGGNERVI